MGDASGHPLMDGEVVNDPVWPAGRCGLALQLDGVGQLAYVEYAPSLDITSAITLAAWVRPDRIGNQAVLEVWPNATIIGHPDMIRKAKDGADAFWIQLMSDMTKGYTNGTRAEIPTVETADGQEFRIGGKTFRIHSSTDAHSKTDLMIEMVEDRILFTGDNVLARQVMNLRDGTFKGVIKETERALELDAKLYIPGHGKSGDRTLVEEQKAWFDILIPEVRRLYDEGMNDFEMKPVIAEKLKAYQGWAEFEANLGPMISLAILEVEQE